MNNKKKLHVVLDLDQTLIFSEINELRKPHDFVIKVGNDIFFVHKRPGLNDFLEKLFKNAKSVSVWTAAVKPYCNQIVKNIFTPNQRKKLKFVRSRSKTSNLNGYYFLKNMNKVFNMYKTMNSHNTILIDDNPDHYVTSSGSLQYIKPWKPHKSKDKELSKILKLL